MIYYRVKPEYDGKYVHSCPGGKFIMELVEGELFTPGELKSIEKQLWGHGAIKTLEAYMEKVEISKSRVYFMFGCRFAMTN